MITINEKYLKCWMNAEWEQLLGIKYNNIKNKSTRANVLLFVASAYQHKGLFDDAKKHFKKSLEYGCSTKDVYNICVADSFNTKARILALINKDDRMTESFNESVNYQNQTNDSAIKTDTRLVKELASLGLYIQARDIIKVKIENINNLIENEESNNQKIDILRMEIDLLSHELSLSQQRMQIYNLSDSVGLIKNDIQSINKRSVSQLGQDIWVLEQTNFKKDGYFVEFGATDGVLLSNSYLLEKEFGWRGICAEPNPKFYQKLTKNRSCITSCDCIGGVSGESVEFVFADVFGGMVKHSHDDTHGDKRQAFISQGEVSTLITISLHDFLKKYNAPKNIDYISIDTEGSEYEILKDFPFEDWDIRLLSVEHNYTKQREKIFKLLNSLGYTRIKNRFDDWYINNN